MSSVELQPELVAGGASLATHDIRWHVTSDWQHALLTAGGLRWDEWRQAGLIRIIKQGAHRTVYLVSLTGREFYLKHYHPVGFGAFVANRLRGSAGRRELRNAKELLRRGLSTAEPIGMGERRGGRESFFVSRAIDNACTIDEFNNSLVLNFDEVGRVSAWRRVMVALEQSCAATHRAGVDHADFHAGNVLVELDTARLCNHTTDLPRLYWIDLPKMRFTAPLDWKRSCASVAVLAAGWLHRTTRTERQRFWNAYLAARSDLTLVERRQAGDEILMHARAHARKTLAGRDKRALATNRDFYQLNDANFVAHSKPEISPADLTAFVREPWGPGGFRELWERLEQMVGCGLPAELKSAGSSRRVTVQITHPRKGWWEFAGLPPASRQWRLANALIARRIRTPRPLFAVQPIDRRRSGYLVTENLEAEPLSLLISGPLDSSSAHSADINKSFTLHLRREGRTEERPRQDLLPTTRRAVAVAVGSLLGELHAWHYTLPYEGAGAITISGHERPNTDNTTTATPVAWLDNLAGVTQLKELSPQLRAVDLCRCLDSLILLRVTRTDRLRCLFAYLRSANLDNDNWKVLWKSVDSRSRYREIASFEAKRREELARESATT